MCVLRLCFCCVLLLSKFLALHTSCFMTSQAEHISDKKKINFPEASKCLSWRFLSVEVKSDKFWCSLTCWGWMENFYVFICESQKKLRKWNYLVSWNHVEEAKSKRFPHFLLLSKILPSGKLANFEQRGKCLAVIKTGTEFVHSTVQEVHERHEHRNHSAMTEIRWGNFQLSSISLWENVCREISVVVRSSCFMIRHKRFMLRMNSNVPFKALIKGFFIISSLLSSFPAVLTLMSIICFKSNRLKTSRVFISACFSLSLSYPPSHIIVARNGITNYDDYSYIVRRKRLLYCKRGS